MLNDAYEKNKINIEYSTDNCIIWIQKDSNLLAVYCIIKTLINYGSCIPQSIFLLKGNLVKIKKSINRFRSYDIWEFLDMKEGSDATLFNDSETIEWEHIKGWEIRFTLEIKNEDISNIYKGYEGLMKNLKKKLKKFEN